MYQQYSVKRCWVTEPSGSALIMSEQYYVAVKGSLHSSDSAVFGLEPVEVTALTKRFRNSHTDVINGILVKGSPMQVINSLSELGYKVVCSSGEGEIVWTLRRDILLPLATSPVTPTQELLQ